MASKYSVSSSSSLSSPLVVKRLPRDTWSCRLSLQLQKSQLPLGVEHPWLLFPSPHQSPSCGAHAPFLEHAFLSPSYSEPPSFQKLPLIAKHASQFLCGLASLSDGPPFQGTHDPKPKVGCVASWFPGSPAPEGTVGFSVPIMGAKGIQGHMGSQS